MNRRVERERIEHVGEPQAQDLRRAAGKRDEPGDRSRVREHEACRVPVRGVGDPVEPPHDPDLVRKRAVRLDDPRLDHDLRARDVEVLDEVEDRREVIRKLLDDERIRPRVDEDVAARRHDLARRGRHLLGVSVRDLLEHGPERAVLVLRLHELKPRVLLLRQLVRGGDAHDVPLEHVAELVDLEDQLEGLVPGNVLQADRDRSANVRVEHDVELRQLAEPLQRVLDVRVLEVQGDGLARVLLVPGAERAGLVGIRDLAGPRGTVLLDEKSFGRLDQGLVLSRGRLPATRLDRGDLGGGGSRRSGRRRSLDLAELGRGLHEARRIGCRNRRRGRAGRNRRSRSGRRRGRCRVTRRGSRRHVERAPFAHDGLLRLVDFMLLVGACSRHRRRGRDHFGRRAHERGLRLGGGYGDRSHRSRRGGDGRGRVGCGRSGRGSRGACHERLSASEGEREPRGPALRGGFRGRREVENDARDGLAPALELGDAHTAHGRVPDVLRLPRRREENAREIDDIARRILKREGLVCEAAVAGERRDEFAVLRPHVDRRQARRG